jgi:hypothetical protein
MVEVCSGLGAPPAPSILPSGSGERDFAALYWSGFVYVGLLGVVLLGVPNVLLAVFSLPGTTEVWIRVVGMLALILAF